MNADNLYDYISDRLLKMGKMVWWNMCVNKAGGIFIYVEKAQDKNLFYDLVGDFEKENDCSLNVEFVEASFGVWES